MVMCWVPECRHYNVRETCKFFVFPKNRKERNRWLKLIRRVDKPGPGARVCSCHFQEGKRENGPEIFAHNVGKRFQQHHLTPEKKKTRTRKTHIQQTTGVARDPTTSASHEESIEGIAPLEQHEPALEGIEPVREPLVLQQPALGGTVQSVHQETAVESLAQSTTSVPTGAVALEVENYFLNQKLQETEALLQRLTLRFGYTHIMHSDKMVLMYTGLPTAHIFDCLCSLLQNVDIDYYLQWKVVNIDRRDQILMALMKLRQNFPHEDLALRFGISQGTVTNIVVTVIHVFHHTLFKQLMKKIPSRHKNQSCLPNCFSTFTNCRIIQDCTEITSAVPRKSMTMQKATYSSYKHKNTWKGLVGVAPNGVITYCSRLYPGSTSDKKIVEICGVLTQLEPGDLVLADKGFLIKDLLPAGVSLNLPPFLSTPQFTPEQIQRTRVIAKARIHVERAIRRMKVFKILDFISPALCRFGSTIFQTVAALTNLQYPLIKEVEQLYCDDE